MCRSDTSIAVTLSADAGSRVSAQSKLRVDSSDGPSRIALAMRGVQACDRHVQAATLDAAVIARSPRTVPRDWGSRLVLTLCVLAPTTTPLDWCDSASSSSARVSFLRGGSDSNVPERTLLASASMMLERCRPQHGGDVKTGSL